jgi:hypothetical protein
MVSGFVHLAPRFHQAYLEDRIGPAPSAGRRRARPALLRNRVGHGLIHLGERLVSRPAPPTLDKAA